ncbi:MULTISPECIES: DNA mismatch repair protein MutS [Aerococcus]|uniref:DNA mismatch repair protein MutS n=1 Tax=Aerococcus TaxID=1375 RepID=UPI001E657387|nr:MULTISPECIES: DNA mismatch repair protein MutS [Aerococcus]MCY3063288.1 DNA mismatch repair protein MutS [Aerococcus mictus]MCY3066395.1 DNA mismatch repair protein MutS [Aerococcus mictus]MCY3071345.1 DNA mismatch repair protein MutS [Aerococcus mictus]MCY3074164.1 DNA mismatch repair protein MutS [Aerococcus mictus]MCY3079234.1 DNA mismatch repair protein MutS [Aerococcus mictus]
MAKKKTPMMEQYYQIKDQYPDAFLFFRLGDFYEMFDDDAKKAAQILEITLTSRNRNADDPIPMCGVPYHSADEYVKTLVNQGYKVAIAEQMEDPKQAKGMVDRQVIKVITPGTYYNSSDKENVFICAIIHQEGAYALAYTDISTGELKVTHMSAFEMLLTEFSQIQAKEVVFYHELREEDLAQLEQLFPFTSSYINQKTLDQLPESAFENIMQNIKHSIELKALRVLMAYVYSTQFRMVNHWRQAESYELDYYLHMDYFAKRNLELTESIRTQKRSGSLLHFLDETKTAMGGRLLRQWLDRPLIIQKTIEERLDQVESLIDAFFERRNIQENLSGVYDLERLVAKISMGQVNARELLQLMNSLKKVPQVSENLQAIQDNQSDRQGTVVWTKLLNSLAALPEVVETIESAIDPEANISITEGSIIRDGFSDQLDDYREAIRHGSEWIANLQAKEREATGIKSLKIGYNKVFGYYIEVTKANLHLLPEGRYERKQTLTNAERFITPELKEMEYRILEAQEKSVDLEYELFLGVREKVKVYQKDLQAIAQAIAQVDVIQSLAEISEQNQYVRPHFSGEDRDLLIKDSRHPVVEETLGRDDFVPNDIIMDKDTSILLITGPNMSGKSTYMRQLGLTVIMAQMGSFVPASQATLPIFDQIFTRIGATDDLQAGQSTFMVEMMEANQAIQHATDRSLLLFDEIGRGTSTYDGIALAQAILEYLHDHLKAKVLFSTHYHELTDLDNHLPALKNIHVGAIEKDGEVVFLHKVYDGPADKSYGIHVAKLAGLPKSLLTNAAEILSDLESAASKGAEPKQLNLFTDQENLNQKTASEDYVLDQLDAVDINHLSPIEALELLNQLQRKLSEED